MNNELLNLKKEKNELKKNYSNKFLGELEIILEKCFLKNKTKKEQFITREKIEIELIKLLQTQKKFHSTYSTTYNFNLLAVFDTEENMVGKIIHVNLETNEVQFQDITGNIKLRTFNNIVFFDKYSIEMQTYFEKQRKFYDSYNYKDTFAFLTHCEKKKEDKKMIRYGLVDPNARIALSIPIDYNK